MIHPWMVKSSLPWEYKHDCNIGCHHSIHFSGLRRFTYDSLAPLGTDEPGMQPRNAVSCSTIRVASSHSVPPQIFRAGYTSGLNPAAAATSLLVFSVQRYYCVPAQNDRCGDSWHGRWNRSFWLLRVRRSGRVHGMEHCCSSTKGLFRGLLLIWFVNQPHKMIKENANPVSHNVAISLSVPVHVEISIAESSLDNERTKSASLIGPQ